MGRRFVKELYEQLPTLVQDGVLDQASAQRLEGHYGELPDSLGKRVLIVFLSIVGVTLIGAGITLVIGHNWNELSRPARTVLAFLPLLAGQAAAFYTLIKAPDSTAWREGAGTFLFLGIGTCIALVAQTYHMPGSFDTFQITWMLLALPLVYLLRASMPAILYLVGITCWAGYCQRVAGEAVGFWLLLALVLPYVILVHKGQPFGFRAVSLRWALVLCLAVALGIVLEKVLPGLWIPVYLSFLGLIYLAGGQWEEHADSMWQQPMRIFGAGGVGVVVLLLSWEWPWDEIGWYHTRSARQFHEWAAIPDYLVLAVLMIGALVLLVTRIRCRKVGDLLLGSAPIVGLIGYAMASQGEEVMAQVLFNVYTLVIGLGLVGIGLKEHRLSRFNGGMVLFAALVTARFFDEDIPFLIKGLVFIAFGIGFLVCNIIIVRRKGGAS